MTKLVSDLEKLRQAENENLKLQKTEVDLLELAETVVKGFETQLAEKNLRCTVTGTRTGVFVDRDRIQQVITNLISNAVKYSNENGTIRVVLKKESGDGIIQVEDEGIGIAQEDQKYIFERFYRTDQSRNRKTGGAGIGLAITKSIVQAHGGTITVESEVGHGSRFTVRLPE